jgi:hypothetical protein
VLRTSCSGLAATSHAKSFVRFIAKPAHGSGAKATDEKFFKGLLLCATAIFADPPANGFAKNLTLLLSCLVRLGRFIRSFSRSSFTHSLHSLHNLC